MQNHKKHPLKRLLNLASPILRPLILWYLSKNRTYRYKRIKIKVHAGVFHPGFFFSTKILLRYLQKEALQGLNVLELGAGTGLISLFCYEKGAIVTASDVTEIAIQNIRENAAAHKAHINIIKSDLFDALDPNEFELIIINPPYYPKAATSESEKAWFCGPDFEYFEKLFSQLGEKRKSTNKVIMILSEDCQLENISSIAEKHHQILKVISKSRVWGEENFIFSILPKEIT